MYCPGVRPGSIVRIRISSGRKGVGPIDTADDGRTGCGMDMGIVYDAYGFGVYPYVNCGGNGDDGPANGAGGVDGAGDVEARGAGPYGLGVYP